MADIVITEFMDEEAIASCLAGFDVLYDPHLVDKPDELTKAVAGARGVIVRNSTQLRGDLLAAAGKLRAVGRLGVGLDNIDVAACEKRGIAVYPATGANDVSVAEYVIGTALFLLRGTYYATFEVIAGRWPRSRLIGGREIAGKRLGLVGFGSIAKEVAVRAAAMGMQVSAYDPHVPADAPAWTQPFGKVERLPLDELLAASDVVSLHVPLTDETRNLIDASRLALMKRDAILINAARGGVVDEEAVSQALKENKLGGAALDVFDEEPLPEAKGVVFGGAPNVILTPHIAGLTVESNRRVSTVTAQRIAKHLSEG
ncbi:hydroxyacid dehydrogenase [Enterovirga rhinocerotis]|uniref:(S)-sulfolactate dehydrogenase n=1 Tax=Enterovirga rhinocerotis TaxID=1339210 RepID=A0A4R7C9I3_9HYPH|nr:hydroxyacid dehydrogenase [Enterovirga rhinocerotis]TDR94005.1 (S)-sulfolactate dehydrogenase [Enterovirga rhinocerotis]